MAVEERGGDLDASYASRAGGGDERLCWGQSGRSHSLRYVRALASDLQGQPAPSERPVLDVRSRFPPRLSMDLAQEQKGACITR